MPDDTPTTPTPTSPLSPTSTSLPPPVDVPASDAPPARQLGDTPPAGAELAPLLPSDQREALAKFGTVPDLSKSYLELQAHLGRDNRIALPADDSSPDVWNTFYAQLGRPDTPAEYGTPPLPEGSLVQELPQVQLTAFKQVFHDIGLNDKQSGKLIAAYADMQNAELQGILTNTKAANESAKQALTAEWGPAYDQNYAQALDALNTFDPVGDGSPEGEFYTFLNETGGRNDPRVIRFLQRVGRNLAEDVFHRGGRGSDLIDTPDELAAKIEELRADKDFGKALVTSSDPGHAAAAKQWKDLHERQRQAAADALLTSPATPATLSM